MDRDGNGQVIEIVTKERISKDLIESQLPKEVLETNQVTDENEIQ